MTTLKENLNGWAKILSIAVPLAIGGLVGYGRLVAQVEATEAARLEDRITLLRELDQIHAQLDRMEMKLGPAARR